MPKMTLTAAVAQNAVCQLGKRRTDIWCDQISGFVLTVREGGGKSFSLRFTQNGRQKNYTICQYGELSFSDVRKAAWRLRSEIVLGGDPAGDRAVKRAIPTYAELAEQHLAHAQPLKSYESLETIVRLHLIPTFGKMRLTDVTPQLIVKWMAGLADQGLMPATIEKCRTTLGRAFTLAARWSIPGAEVNPVRLVEGPKFDNRRQRFLTAEEAGRLLEAAGKSLNPQLRPIIALLLLTGARISELLQAERGNVDLARRTWLIPTSKNGKSRHVPLSQAAVDIIEALPKLEGNSWLLPNLKTMKRFVGIKHGFQKARRDAGLEDVRIHDLRHSAASFMINAGIDLFAVGKVLGHRQYSSTLIYAHASNTTLLAAVEAGAAGMKVNPSF